MLLYMRLSPIKRAHNEPQDGGDKHHFDEKEEVSRALQLHCAVGVLDEMIDLRREYIPEGDRAEVSAHHQ